MKKPTPNKHTMKQELLSVGLDVHAKNIAIALAEGGGGEPRTYGSIPSDLHALEKVLAKLKKAHPGTELRVCYEAGPTGFVLARRCAQLKVQARGPKPTGVTCANWSCRMPRSASCSRMPSPRSPRPGTASHDWRIKCIACWKAGR